MLASAVLESDPLGEKRAMTDATIVALVILAALSLFIWNRLPAVIVGVGVSLALFATGIITAN